MLLAVRVCVTVAFVASTLLDVQELSVAELA